jgi:uncharacterized membrane protein YfcA
MYDFAFVLAGFVVGFVVGLTGVGGGSLMTPLLIFGFGIKPYLAVGTDLLFAAGTKFSGALGLWRDKRIDWPVVALLSAGSIPASLATILVLRHLGPAEARVQALTTTTLGVALLLTAAATLYKVIKGKVAPRSAESAQPAAATRPRHWALPVLFGAVIGSLVSLTSVGAGAIGVTVLMLLYPKLTVHRIVGSDIAHAVPLTLVAGIGHWAIGDVDWHMLVALLCGSIPGILVASRIAPRIDERIIRWLLAIILAIVGLRLALS